MLSPNKEFFKHSCGFLAIVLKINQMRKMLLGLSLPAHFEYEYAYTKLSLDTYQAYDLGHLNRKEVSCALNDTFNNFRNMPEYDTLFTDEPFVVVSFLKSLKDTTLLIDFESHPFYPKGFKQIFSAYNKTFEDYINGVSNIEPDIIFTNLFSCLFGSANYAIKNASGRLPTEELNLLASAAIEWYPEHTALIEELIAVVEDKVELAQSNLVVSKLDNLLLLKWTKEAWDMFTDISDSMELNAPLVEDFDRRTVESWKEINPGLLQEAIDAPALQIRQIDQNHFLVAFLYPDDTVECKIIDFTNTKLSGKQFSCAGSGRYEHPFTPEAKVVVELNVTIV